MICQWGKIIIPVAPPTKKRNKCASCKLQSRAEQNWDINLDGRMITDRVKSILIIWRKGSKNVKFQRKNYTKKLGFKHRACLWNAYKAFPEPLCRCFISSVNHSALWDQSVAFRGLRSRRRRWSQWFLLIGISQGL